MLTYQKTCLVLSDCIINIQAGYICEIECVPVYWRILSLNIQICDKYNLYCTMCGFSVSTYISIGAMILLALEVTESANIFFIYVIS